MEENQELKRLYEEDVRERRHINWDNNKEVDRANKNDLRRRQRVLGIINEGGLKLAVDFHNAALIFQHGDTPDDYKKANELATSAIKLGYKRSKWLYAAKMDRWLLSLGKAQKYGTQFVTNNDDEIEIANPIDPSVTDTERAKYNVPPLANALKVYKKKYELK